jgi:hypothetical protein
MSFSFASGTHAVNWAISATTHKLSASAAIAAVHVTIRKLVVIGRGDI